MALHRFCKSCDCKAGFTVDYDLTSTVDRVTVIRCNNCNEPVTIRHRASAKRARLEATLRWLLNDEKKEPAAA